MTNEDEHELFVLRDEVIKYKRANAELAMSHSQLYIDLQRALLELLQQWETNHHEHCGVAIPPWPHAGECHWPLPSSLTNEQVAEALATPPDERWPRTVGSMLRDDD